MSTFQPATVEVERGVALHKVRGWGPSVARTCSVAFAHTRLPELTEGRALQKARRENACMLCTNPAAPALPVIRAVTMELEDMWFSP